VSEPIQAFPLQWPPGWWDQRRQAWRARITIDWKDHHLGYFDSEAAAASAYDRAALIHFGEHAVINAARDEGLERARA
jgi:hypothetical protein